ncbi:hypothetical protein AWV80_05320 [Cupriavidus sp. UYMU48A]|nr:hypothetical protein AWV80_05320 [Cupriavidus sp. UYMU48A]
MRNCATLYLGFEGVLHPNLVSFYGQRLPRLRAGGHTLFENNRILESVIDDYPNVAIVLHTWWVPLLGYRAAIEMLPESVREKVIGATWRGIKGPRARLKMAGPRRAWLDEDSGGEAQNTQSCSTATSVRLRQRLRIAHAS